MEFNYVDGRYNLSLFRMFVDTNASFDTLSQVPPQHIPTYFHEYFHFLQDITTPFGFNVMWQEYDRTHRLIHHVQQERTDIQLPLKARSEFELYDTERDFMKAIFLDQVCMINGKPFAGSLTVNPLALRLRTEFSIEGVGQIRFVQLAVDDGAGNSGTYWFGAIAVIETMTYLIQKKFFGAASVPDFPYMAAVRVAEHGNPAIAANEEFVFALCELALMTQYPGWTFYDLLIQMAQRNLAPKNAEEIYQFAMPFLEEKWHISERFEAYRNRIEFNLRQLYGHEAYRENLQWHLEILNKGYELRQKDPMLLLGIYRQRRPFDTSLFVLLHDLGAPEVINNERKRWFAAPKSLKHMEGSVHTLFISALGQLQNTLMDGATRCELYDHCKGSEQQMPLDHHCFESPWEKTKQEKLCPFALAWKSFGLDEFETKPIEVEIDEMTIEVSPEEYNELGFARFRTGKWSDAGVGDYIVRLDEPHIPGGQWHVHIAHGKNKSAKGKQVSWNEDGSRHDQKSFDESFVGLEKAKSIARQVLGISNDIVLKFIVGQQPVDEHLPADTLSINFTALSFTEMSGSGKKKD